jgi:hypothetical protein
LWLLCNPVYSNKVLRNSTLKKKKKKKIRNVKVNQFQ